jgi:hypothetical protein
MLAHFVNDILQVALSKTQADKNFIANLAKRAVESISHTIPDHVTSSVLLVGVYSKNLSLAEFALSSLKILV